MSRFIGNVSAYAYAVSKGYTGTEEEFAELMASYANVGQTAVDAAESALNSKTAAQTAATTATNKASEATTKATEANTSAQTASMKASEAVGYVETATQKATEAAQSASQALGYKNDAESAKTASQTAQGLAESARDTSVSAKTDAESARDDAVQAKEDAESAVASIADALDDKAPVITDTASGAIASFSDGADDLPLKSLVVDINPVQDLHGQESPYPAGGGKNLYNKDADYYGQGKFWRSDKGVLDNSTEYYGSPKAPIKPETAYARTSGTSANIFYDANGDYLSAAYTGGTFTTPANAYYVAFNIANSVNHDTVQLEEGSSLSAYSPYENICPISGWTEINAYNDPLHGGNIEWNQIVRNVGEDYGIASSTDVASVTYNDTTRAATYQNNNTANGRLICHVPKRFKNTHTYLLSCDITCSIQGNIWSEISLGWVRPFRQNINANVKTRMEGIARTSATASDNLNRLQFFDNAHANSDYTLVVENLNFFDLTQMFGAGNEPSTVEEFRALFPNDYYPYNEGEKTTVSAVNEKPYTHVNIQLGQTVYGGKLDVLSGELTIDRAMVDLGTLNWEYQSNYERFRANLSDVKTVATSTDVANILCAQYATTYMHDTRYSIIGRNAIVAIGNGQNRYVYLVDVAYDNTVDFKNAMNGVQLVYELATPLTIQLTPNQVNSLLGVNNIWADSGDTEVEYRADTKLYIAKKIAEAISALS